MSRNRQQGLTLPELLIALLIFAMISGAAVYALRLSVEGREQLENADRDIREMQVFRQIMKQDLANVVARAPRDEYGVAYPAPFLGGEGLAFRPPVEGEAGLIAFVRRGWINVDERAPRSSLQAVEYLVKNGDLIRRTRPYLDDARGQPRTDRVLIKGVGAVSIAFATGAQNPSGPEYVAIWPTPQGRGDLPRALRVSMTTPRFGAVNQYFWLGAAE